MLRASLCGALLCAASCSHTTPIDEPVSASAPTSLDWEDVEHDLDQIMNAYGAPSLSVAVVKDGNIIYANAFGYSDLDDQVPATVYAQYAIGSVVKTFTSGLIGTLEDDGLIDLSAHPSAYLGELDFGSSDLDENLTLANLLSQTSGLPDISGSLAFFPAGEQEDLLPRLSQFPASCRVGDCWQYNNLNFILLDAIAERVSGQSKSDLLTERLIQPAGMVGTLSSTRAFDRSDTGATGYAQVNGAPIPTATEYLYGEQIYSTASDLARWLDVWMSGGSGVLSADYASRAISMQAISDGSPPSQEEPGVHLFGYGYGWRVRSRDGNYQLEHGGNENGFSTQVLFIPAKQIGVVALTNQQDSILPYIANDILIRRMLSQPITALEDYPVQVREAAPMAAQEGIRLKINADAPPSLEIDALVGRYQAAGYGQAEVAYSDGVFTFETPAARFVLVHKAHNSFGLTSHQPVPLGINIEFFEITFDDDTLAANFAAQPVVFSRVQ